MRGIFGAMPLHEVEIMKVFNDDNNLTVVIQAGPKGWTIIWADYSTTYSDVNNTSENNFAEAYNTAVEMVGPLKLYACTKE